MTKSRFDSRTIGQIVEFLKTERTVEGDTIKFLIKYNGLDRPTLTLKFFTYNVELAHMPMEEEISSWLPEHYQTKTTDDFGRPIENYSTFVSSWAAYVERFVIPIVEKIIRAGGRRYVLEEVRS